MYHKFNSSEQVIMPVDHAALALDFRSQTCSSQLFTFFHSCLTPTLFRRSMVCAGLIQASPGVGAPDEDESESSNWRAYQDDFDLAAGCHSSRAGALSS
jgi:hypothetical protein